MIRSWPCYLEAHRTGLLARRAEEAVRRLARCDLCPRACGVDRIGGERGVCGAGAAVEVASWGPHFGEEPPLVGRHGSGTIFLAHCGLRCCFCQNADISFGGADALSAGELALVMLRLQALGCHNVNFVTPTHYLPQILAAVDSAAGRGLEIPLVWNCGGYEDAAALELLEGVVDIYMPDVKFADAATARRFCGAPDYFEVARRAVREMHRQVGDLEIGAPGTARRGLLVRHLVLPDGLAGTEAVMAFLAGEISRDTWVNVMDQYRPCHRAREFPELARRIAPAERAAAVATARRAGLHRGIL
jgi:putative pyruvate formate lyase activating enzyme